MIANALTMRGIAETLIASGAAERSAASDTLSFALGQLRPNLLMCMGRGGTCALVSRALFLASRGFPALRDVTANDDGTIAGLDEAGEGLNKLDFSQARLALLTEVLLLLLKFLGPGMTLAIISDAWPNAALDNIDLSQMRET